MPKPLIALALLAVLVSSAVASDLDSLAPAKPAATHPAPPPDPNVIRQGGDTMADAILLAVPGSATGTTVGYSNDYDEVCPYTDSTAPDVVYKLAPTHDYSADIDMLGSTYDTKIYVYREDFTLVACNDDFYPDYVSKLEDVPLEGDVKYFLVIDGYGASAGDYVLNIGEFVPCALECPSGAQLEGEPPLVDDYSDEFNGGCNSPGADMFGEIHSYYFCGVSGWFSYGGSNFRDTDWFELTIPPSGFFEILGDAEYATNMMELGPMDCDAVGVIQSVVIGPCSEDVMTIYGSPGDIVWFCVAPTVFDGPVNEYDYVIFMNMWQPAVRSEAHSWTAVKKLFR